jgi:metal-responsive CopG/Arc/MetJ family transcriptional regulator
MEKKMFSTLLKNDLLKEFKKLAIDLERPVNDLLEEAMRELLKKYNTQEKKTKK